MKYISLSCAFLLALAINTFSQPLTVDNLKCEYKTNPVGIDEMSPRFQWQLNADRRGTMQTAYQIRIADSERSLTRKKRVLWDSGKIDSDQCTHVEYKGPELASRMRYYWQVKVWDNYGNESEWSTPAYWEMGLLSTTDWEAEWIQSPGQVDSMTSQPSPFFRKEFELGKNIVKARAYITALGLYEAEINGKKVGDQVFTPGWTSYDTRLQYQTYDVTDLLQTGKNAIGMALGDGWYRGFIGFSGQRNFYGDKLGLLLQLEVTYKNGDKALILSDGSWHTTTGPIQWSDIYNGEAYDANQEMPGWSTAGFDERDWNPVLIFDHAKDILIAPAGPPIRRMQELEPVEVIQTPKGETVFDLGQNMVGRVRLQLDEPQGTKISIYHAEILDKEGNFYTENLRAAKQLLEYTCKGGGEIYEPVFTFQGFRYVKIEGLTKTPNKDMLTGVVIYSEMPVTGSFECSNPLVNQLQHNIQWGQKGNFLDVPTDCPQRDERLGWTGDAQAFSRTAAFNMDVASFFTKWLADLEADQREDGAVPFVIPNVLGPNAAASAGWADAATIVPWTVYMAYGDKRILEDQYDSMKAWVKYMEDVAGDDYLWNTGFHFGDWLFYSINDDRDGRSAITDKYLLAQAFFAHSTNILRKTAEVLGKKKDATYYGELLEKVVAAFQMEYLTPNGRLVSSTQTAYVLALEFDLFPPDQRESAARRLIDNINRYNNHLTTGFLGTPHLCHVLTEYGYVDTAYVLFEQETYPSWLYPVTMGATTIWERWDGIKPDSTLQNASMNSFNHYAYGAIGEWMYKVIAGINPVESNPGYKEVRIHPQPGGHLTEASASHESLYGAISSGWVLENGEITITVAIPPNVMADVRLPDAKNKDILESGIPLRKKEGILNMQVQGEDRLLRLGSGNYEFKYRY